MSIDVLQHLKEEFQDENGKFTPGFIEEYTVEGELDYRYIAKKFNTRITKSESARAAHQIFETIIFEPNREYENEVIQREFLAHYEFGKYPDVRGWITHIERETGQVLTREACYGYVVRTN